MLCNEKGVLSGSDYYFYSPSQMAKEQLFYYTSVGQFFCDMNYCVEREEDYGNYLLLLVNQGRMEIHSEGETFILKKGEIAFINCHNPHMYRALGMAEFMWLHFDGSNAADFYNHLIRHLNGHHFFRPENNLKKIEKRFHDIILECRYGNTGLELEDSLNIYGLLIEIRKSLVGSGTKSGSVGDPVIDKSLRYITENLNQDLSVPVLAGYVGLSESHFSRRFRKTMNSSPKEYVIRKRLNEAKRLLKTTSWTVGEIGFAVGFHSESHFVNSFTDQNGISPGKFRDFPI